MSALPSFAIALPEILLAGGALVLLSFGAIRGDAWTGWISWASVALLAAALVVLLAGPEAPAVTFAGAYVRDDFAVLMKALVLVGAGAVIVMSLAYLRVDRLGRFEFPLLIVLATLGMMVMVSAGDLIALYLGLELQSLALYVAAAIRRDSLRSTEAGLKYFVLGALSSGMLLYGASLAYGFAGSVNFAVIASATTGESQASLGLVFAIVFIVAGLAFKVSAVPFHMWTPDVYEGAPTPVTAFFSAAPKVAAMALFVRVMMQAFPGVTEEWRQIVVFLAIASMVLGAFAAIGQRNIKRLLAYSSIGHMGYALVGLAAGSEAGVSGVIIYVAIYLAMTLGTFGCVLAMRRGETYVEEISDLAGLARNQPVMAFILAMLMFSLAGVPPLAGFFAKFYVFLAAVEAQLFTLAVIGVVASVIGAYYYLRIVKIMYFDEPAESFEAMPGGVAVVVGLSGAFTVLFFLYPSPLVQAADAAARSLF